ncbi:type VI secretion system contractile sheath protein TssC [Spirosoma sp.]|uniref:type VI secretion system contractile sheath protein TssC n=1 Tax=Spirosoma sp. TaxID=1899569 RepID=UPI002605DC2C|nr:type VI secretion system contractile sheath protein TssC [Spirosoma sp.]MCX6216953.1 type VI secretion system contractile sheath protein TssC [Spirosoma sp.]
MEAQKSENTSQPVRENEQASPSLEQQVAQLKKLRLGDFKLLETVIPGTENLNPDRGNKRTLWLNDPNEARKADRKKLMNRLEIWRDLLSDDTTSTEQITSKADNLQKSLEALLKTNLYEVTQETRELESTYRGVASFFINAETSGLKVRNVHFVDAPLEQLNPEHTDYEGETLEYIKKSIHQVYNQFDLTDSYSLLVVPGYLGSKVAVDTWATIANNHKLMLITDFVDEQSLEMIRDSFLTDEIASDEGKYANVLMTANYLVGRGKYTELEEEEDLYVAPSAALAGKVYMNLISQSSMGLQYGALEQTNGVRLDLLKTEVGELENLGLIPMTKAFGKVIPFSARTLYNGSNVGLKTYSVVRVFDWIMKVLMHFLNKRAGENWSSTVEQQIKKEIIRFLDSITGPGRVIDRFDTPKFDKDPADPSRIVLDINITPFFPAKTFIINLHGEQGLNPNTARRNSFEGSIDQRRDS